MSHSSGCESVFEVTSPLRIFCKIFGFQLFTVYKSGRDGSHRIKTSLMDVFCGVSSFVCYGLFLAINIKWNVFIEHTSSHTINLASRFLAIYGFSVQALGVLVNIFFRKNVWRLLQGIHRCDTIMRVHHVEVEFTRQHRVIASGLVAIVSLFTVLGFVTILLHGDINPKFYITHACYFVVTLSYAAFMLQFIFMMMVVRWRFTTLNDAFRRRFGLGEVQEVVAAKVGALKLFWHDDTAFITDLAIMHDLLTDSVSLLNSCFSIQAMAWVCGSFCLNVLGFFTLYRFIVQNRWDQLVVAAVYSMWLSFDCMFVILAIMEGSNIGRQGRNTATLIHKAINKHFDSPPLTEKLKLISQQLLHRRPEVSCGLFTYDWPYFASTVGAMAMYLCIMIQFDTAEGSP